MPDVGSVDRTDLRGAQHQLDPLLTGRDGLPAA
jgi:hypothetical protein